MVQEEVPLVQRGIELETPEARLAQVRIVLMEPAGALNVGAIARVMKNMGLSQLVVVNPHCEIRGDEARTMAVHAGDVLDQAVIVPSLPAALVGCQRAIATTGRDQPSPDHPLEFPRQALPWLVTPGVPSALIFGTEDRGLSNDELNYAQRFVRIPSSDRYVSLNLAQAVAVCGYELYQAAAEPAGHGVKSRPQAEALEERPGANLEQLEHYYQAMEALLLRVGYLYPHTAKPRMAKLRRLLHRAYPSTEELALLQGMVRQVNWALQQSAGDLQHPRPETQEAASPYPTGDATCDPNCDESSHLR